MRIEKVEAENSRGDVYKRQIIRFALLAVALVLLLLSCFLKGNWWYSGLVTLTATGFYTLDISVVQALSLIHIWSLLDYFVIAAVVVYLIACIQAVYIRSALIEVLRYFSCYLTYILVKDLLAEKKIHFMAVSYLAGIMMTILTVGVAADSWVFSGYYNELEHILTSVSYTQLPTAEVCRLEDVKLLAPCDPTKIVAVGLNYADHAKEMNEQIPPEPKIFIKPATAVIGPGDVIQRPDSERVDYEGELAIVIKTRAKDCLLYTSFPAAHNPTFTACGTGA